MKPPAGTLLATFLLTAGGLLFEVAITRQLSLIHYSGFVFAVLSAALLGLGLGAALAAIRPAWRSRSHLSTWAGLAALSVLLAVTGMSFLAGSGVLLFPLLLTALPFLFSGLALSSLFSLWPGGSHRLYWADLMGAGAGTLLALPLLDLTSATVSALGGGLLLALASLLFGPGRPLGLLATIASVALLGGSHYLQPDVARFATGKPLTGELRAGATVVAQASDSFGHSHLTVRPATQAHYLYVDGAAGSLVPLHDDPLLRRDIGYLPFAALGPESVFLLGPGGGLDASLARLAGSTQLVAAELNSAGLDLVQSVAPHAYRDVELHVDEGRSVLRHLGGSFDLILLSHVITQSSDLRGFALSEASTYTVEAFGDYLDHLNPGGLVALKLYDELTLSRAFFTAFTALAEAGNPEPAAHLFAALDLTGAQPLPLLLVGRDSLDLDTSIGLARQAEDMGFNLLYAPGLLANPPLDGLASGDADVAGLVAAAAAGGVDLQPVTDDRPFFFQFETGLPLVLRPVAYGALAVFVLTWLLLAVRRRPENWPAAPLVFASLGAGFMTMQLGVIQQSQLFLGHPTLTLSVVLATFLIGGGLGSLLGERMRRPLLWAPLLTILLAVVWHLSWPSLTQALQGSQLPIRLGVTVLTVLPLTLVLGMQFPAGLRQLAGLPAQVATAWAVNGIHSVVGSVATVAIALIYGYQATLVLGVACYLLVLLGSLRLRTAV